MFDIDPPSPILRLTGPQSGTQPTLASNGQALAQHTQSSKPRVHLVEALADHWARLHTSRADLRALATADGHLAQRIDRL